MNRVRIIAIGNELLEGMVPDTNSHWLAQRLFDAGWNLERLITVPDQETAIARTVRENFFSAPVTLVMGGMGPTTDDKTVEALSGAFHRPLRLEYRHLRDMEHWFHQRKRPMNLTNLKQSLIPRGFTYLHNTAGTAPMLQYRSGRHYLWAFPGVPSEMKHLFEKYIIPALQAQGSRTRHGVISVFNISESRVQEIVRGLTIPASVEMGYLPAPHGIRIKFRVQKDTPVHRKAFAQARKILIRTFQKHLYSIRGLSLPEELGLLLKRQNLNLSLAESCTGGWISSLIVSVAGSTAYYRGGAVTYSNEEKIRQLGVRAATLQKHGAVSEETAREMAAGIARRSRTEVSLGVTGIAGPGGGSPAKPVGTVCIAACGPWGMQSQTSPLFGERNILRERAAYAALFYLFSLIRNQGG
jgi:nicotinamide-nucleotide amidase